MTQDDNLLPWRTTIDNVLFPLEVQGALERRRRARAPRCSIRAVGLAGFERYYPHELSGGMRKRAALIRTLVYDPPIILMDEPFAAVDAQTRTQLQDDLLTLWGLGRKTIIFVTHDITEAIALGDRALVLSRQPTRIAAEHAIPIPRPRNVKDIFALPKASPRSTNASGRTSNDQRRIDRCRWCPTRRPRRARGRDRRAAACSPCCCCWDGSWARARSARCSSRRRSTSPQRIVDARAERASSPTDVASTLARLRARLRHRLRRRRAAAVPAAPLAAGERGGRALHHGLDGHSRNTRWRRG